MKGTVLFLVVAVLVVGSMVGYFGVGWSRMESACTAEPPGTPAVRSVEFGWSWTPLEFQCTYDNGA